MSSWHVIIPVLEWGCTAYAILFVLIAASGMTVPFTRSMNLTTERYVRAQLAALILWVISAPVTVIFLASR